MTPLSELNLNLSAEQETLICIVINAFGTDDHPMANHSTLYGFMRDYVVECLHKAIPLAHRLESIENVRALKDIIYLAEKPLYV